MDAERKQRVARATADLLQAVRELAKAKANRERQRQRALIAEPAPQGFLRAIEAFAEAIAS